MAVLRLLNMCLIASISFKLIIAFFILNMKGSRFAEAAHLGNDTDKLALLDIKSHLTDYPVEVFSTWNDSLNFCQWKGVTCSNRRQRVIGLSLKRMNLYGNLSPSIGNLSFLQALDLSGNFLDGFIPPEIGRLTRLKNLNLSFNSLAGGIPGNLSGCYNLVNVSLDHNFLKQQIPWEVCTPFEAGEIASQQQ
ncbi:UNVERIFIED_CONTAM: LRR receptor-like serine/threonine-protein kinase EFR [Sesamum angustifolium]|uniref:LRR receptor-like serine/threonine-protein kinase EFR n=1 Tax=Sesamum angustifolium TaxID=2727405 RepID=A0AAW2NK95_9LAMI